MKNRKPLLLAFVLLAFTQAACGGTIAEPAASVADAADAAAEALPTEVPPTETPLTETPMPELEPGDPQRGQNIFINGGSHEFYNADTACITCHSLDGRVGAGTQDGPSLLGVGTRGGERVPRLAADEYLRESIMDSKKFITPSYPNKMSPTGARYLTEQEVEDVIAFLLTLTDDVVLDVDSPPAEPVVEGDVDLAMVVADGNPTRGRIMSSSFRCTNCHANEELPDYAPPFASTDDLPPIMARGKLRITDPAYEGRAVSNQEYILESLLLPEAYIVPGEWGDVMPYNYHNFMTDEDIANILSWLATFE